MTRPILRHWCAECRYPGLEPFIFGTVQAESEMQAIRALADLWITIVPFPAPPMIPLPGMLAFRPEEVQ
ncbi:MAG: hypothetical protein RL490_114 [Pseudomonadota bacterium]|jgi:hypothetical protein